jgi:SAM-dependent methyltransferase
MSDYGALASEFYELDKPEAPPDAFDFYAGFAREARGPIHEPMCGTGRFLLPLLAEGLDISGSDSSGEMLARCATGAERLGLRAVLSRQSVDQLTCVAAPALVFIPSGSFSLLIEDSLVEATLRRVHEVLAPGGSFLFDAERLLSTTPQASHAWGGRWVERADGAKVLFSWLGQPSGAENLTSFLHRYELVVEGRLVQSEFEEFRVRCHAEGDLRRRLLSAGFARVEAMTPYARSPVLDSDEAIVFLAQKA